MSNNEKQSKSVRFDEIAELVRRHDDGELKPLSIAALQRSVLVKQIQQI